MSNFNINEFIKENVPRNHREYFSMLLRKNYEYWRNMDLFILKESQKVSKLIDNGSEYSKVRSLLIKKIIEIKEEMK